MASIEKVANAGVVNWLRHNNRCIDNDKNKDIDVDRTKNNYSLTSYIPDDLKNNYSEPDVREKIRKLEYAHYKELKKQFYCYGRKDVNTLVSVVVTLPKEINDEETSRRFFEGVAEFLRERYGNEVSVTIHQDEGKHYVVKDEDGNPVLNEDGKPVKEWHEGRAHLHYTFVPTVQIDKDAVSKKKNPVKAMLQFEEKISAKERINRKELLNLHPDMNAYINNTCHIACNLNSGITKEWGNKSVEQLKAETNEKIINELTKENSKLRGTVKELEEEVKRQKEQILELELGRDRGFERTRRSTEIEF